MSEDPPPLTHLDEEGRPRMVDVGAKPATDRVARARGRLRLSAVGWDALHRRGGAGKGDPRSVAQIAAVQAVKRTADWIPLTHPVAVTRVDVRWREHPAARTLQVEVEVGVHAPTGVEMEALTGCSAALLTVYDMLKAVDRSMVLGPVWLSHKSGGRRGRFDASDPPLDGGESSV
jgi:cyclic pyranopterin phosphate synthase